MQISIRVKSPTEMDDVIITNKEDADLLEYMMRVQSMYHAGGLHWVGGSLWDDEDYDDTEPMSEIDKEDRLAQVLLPTTPPIEYGYDGDDDITGDDEGIKGDSEDEE